MMDAEDIRKLKEEVLRQAKEEIVQDVMRNLNVHVVSFDDGSFKVALEYDGEEIAYSYS